MLHLPKTYTFVHTVNISMSYMHESLKLNPLEFSPGRKIVESQFYLKVSNIVPLTHMLRINQYHTSAAATIPGLTTLGPCTAEHFCTTQKMGICLQALQCGAE